MRTLIKEIRMEENRSVEDLFRATGYPCSSIRAYENDKPMAPLPKLAVIAHALGHNVIDLIEDDYGR